MSVIQTSAYCATCGRQTLHTKQRINHVLHLLLTIITAGLWGLFVWLPLGLTNSSRRAMCTSCGSKPGFASFKHDLGLTREQPAAAASAGEVAPSTWLPPGARPPAS